jgi:hypothetical protein
MHLILCPTIFNLACFIELLVGISNGGAQHKAYLANNFSCIIIQCVYMLNTRMFVFWIGGLLHLYLRRLIVCCNIIRDNLRKFKVLLNSHNLFTFLFSPSLRQLVWFGSFLHVNIQSDKFLEIAMTHISKINRKWLWLKYI